MRRLMRIPIIRLFVINGALGFGFGLVVAAIMFAVDFRGMATLVWRSSNELVAVAFLTIGICTTFAAGAISTAVMLLPERDEDDSSYGGMDLKPIRRRYPPLRVPNTGPKHKNGV